MVVQSTSLRTNVIGLWETTGHTEAYPIPQQWGNAVTGYSGYAFVGMYGFHPGVCISNDRSTCRVNCFSGTMTAAYRWSQGICVSDVIGLVHSSFSQDASYSGIRSCCQQVGIDL